MLPRQDPRRACAKVSDWPERDQQAWHHALTRQNILDEDGGTAAHWSPATIEKNRKGYGRWVTFLRVSGCLDARANPADRVTKSAVETYLAELRRTVSPYTQRNRLGELLAVARAFAPDRDWSWLRSAVSRLDNVARPVVLSETRPMLSPAEVSAWALETMTQLAAEPPSWRRARTYRDALLLALLSLCPGLRRNNVTQMQIGEHLKGSDAGYTIHFAKKEMKQRRPHTEIVPPELTVPIQSYLARYRPLLLKRSASPFFWIADRGRAMNGKAVYDRVTKTTFDVFGITMTPHMFRSAAVNELAIHAPAMVRSGQPLLGNRNYRTTEEHYNKAAGLEASRRFRSLIDSIKERTRQLLTLGESDNDKTSAVPRPTGKLRRYGRR